MEVSGKDFPQGQIGKVKISRLISGGNIISHWAHPRDLIYVNALVRHYFTEEKIIKTLEICEEVGINTIIADPGSGGLIHKYWNERGGKIQWISQGGIRQAVDNGAVGAFVNGTYADSLVKNGQVEKCRASRI